MDTTNDWWTSHDNLVTLVRWLAHSGAEASEIADAVETPWSYTDEYEAAKADEADV